MATPKISELVNKYKSVDNPLNNFYLDPDIRDLDQEEKEELEATGLFSEEEISVILEALLGKN